MQIRSKLGVLLIRYLNSIFPWAVRVNHMQSSGQSIIVLKKGEITVGNDMTREYKPK